MVPSVPLPTKHVFTSKLKKNWSKHTTFLGDAQFYIFQVIFFHDRAAFLISFFL